MNASGQVYVSTGQGVTLVSGPATTYPVMSHSINGKVTIRTDKGTLDVDEVISFMDTMKKRMLIITPQFEKHEQYPALKAAYEQYLLVERMCLGDDQSPE